MLRLAHGPGAALQRGIALPYGSSGTAARLNYTYPSAHPERSGWYTAWRELGGSASEGGR